MRVHGIVLIAALLFTSVALADSLPNSARPILWLTDAYPGEREAQGLPLDINSETLQHLLPHMPDFELQPQVMNAGRAFMLVRERMDACTGKSVYTEERASYAVYSSLPQVVFPPLRMYMLADHRYAQAIREMQQMSPDGQLSLREIMRIDPDLTLGLVRGRSYTPELDEAIETGEYGNQLWMRSVADQSAGLFNMLLSHRVDMTIHTSIATQRFLMRNPSDKELMIVPLREAGEHLPGYMLCSDSDQGREFIQAFNHAIAQASQERAFFDMHMAWVIPAERPYLATLYNKTYGTNFSL